MFIRLINWVLVAALIGTLASILTIGIDVLIKPSLPEINLVDKDVLQIPLKVFTSDGVLIGEFGIKKEGRLSMSKFLKILKMHS